MKFIFVSDYFSNEILGGAELTSEALISYSTDEIIKIKSENVTKELINIYSSYYWIFGNFSNLKFDLLNDIIKKIKYSIIEYDYKHCKYRSFEKHTSSEGFCNCNQTDFGKIINSFFMNSNHIFWMSELQKDLTISRYENLQKKENIILSSIFSKEQLDKILQLPTNKKPNSWTYLKSKSWVKGTEQAEKFIGKNIINSKPIENLSYDDTLKLLSETENLVYLPVGSDTCPRLVIEAKLLNCNLHLNQNVQHQYEPWFNSDRETLINYLENNHQKFWSIIEKQNNKIKSIQNPLNQKISIIIPARNSENTIQKSLDSVLNQTYKNIEVLVVVNGSSDSTSDIVKRYQKKDHRVKFLESEPGIVSALNVGLRASTGDIISRQDSDDIWYKNKLEVQYEYMIHNGFDILGTQMDINSSGILSESNYPLDHNSCVNWLLHSQNPIGHPTVMFKKKIIDRLGGYWELYPYAEDMDLWFRSIPYFKMGNMSYKGILYNFSRKSDYNSNVPQIMTQHYRMIYGIK